MIPTFVGITGTLSSILADLSSGDLASGTTLGGDTDSAAGLGGDLASTAGLGGDVVSSFLVGSSNNNLSERKSSSLRTSATLRTISITSLGLSSMLIPAVPARTSPTSRTASLTSFVGTSSSKSSSFGIWNFTLSGSLLSGDAVSICGLIASNFSTTPSSVSLTTSFTGGTSCTRSAVPSAIFSSNDSRESLKLSFTVLNFLEASSNNAFISSASSSSSSFLALVSISGDFSFFSSTSTSTLGGASLGFTISSFSSTFSSSTGFDTGDFGFSSTISSSAGLASSSLTSSSAVTLRSVSFSPISSTLVSASG